MVTAVCPVITIVHSVVTTVYPVVTLVYPVITLVHPVVTMVYSVVTLVHPVITIVCPVVTLVYPVSLLRFFPTGYAIVTGFYPFAIGIRQLKQTAMNDSHSLCYISLPFRASVRTHCYHVFNHLAVVSGILSFVPARLYCCSTRRTISFPEYD